MISIECVGMQPHEAMFFQRSVPLQEDDLSELRQDERTKGKVKWLGSFEPKILINKMMKVMKGTFVFKEYL